MNLEEELSMLSGEVTLEPVQEQNQTINTQPMQQPVGNQPAMVNLNSAQQQVSQFNFVDMSFDINAPLAVNRNPITKLRLTGQSTGEKFRIRFLPGARVSEVKFHRDEEKKSSFICLSMTNPQIPNFGDSKCCSTHGRAQQRWIIPIIMYPVSDVYAPIQPNTRGELKLLSLGYKTLNDLKEQVKAMGKELGSVDLVATVDKVQYKTFTFIVIPESGINNVINVPELQAQWNQVATPKNICEFVGKLITVEDYDKNYSNYNAELYKNNSSQSVQPQQQYQQMYQQPQQQYQQQGFNGYQQPQQQYQQVPVDTTTTFNGVY